MSGKTKSRRDQKWVINPEWEALDNKPHGKLLINENSYKLIKSGPPPKQSK